MVGMIDINKTSKYEIFKKSAIKKAAAPNTGGEIIAP